MSIKIRLIANALVVAASVTALSLASFFSMSFIREKMTNEEREERTRLFGKRVKSA